MLANRFFYKWNDACKQPSLVSTATRQMITWDYDKAVIEKANYIKANGLKGAMIWELGRGFLSGAEDLNPLLTALGNHLLR